MNQQYIVTPQQVTSYQRSVLAESREAARALGYELMEEGLDDNWIEVGHDSDITSVQSAEVIG